MKVCRKVPVHIITTEKELVEIYFDAYKLLSFLEFLMYENRM